MCNLPVKNLLSIDGLLVADQNDELLGHVELLDFKNKEAVLTDGTKISPFFLYTNLLDFDNRLCDSHCFSKPNNLII